MTTEYSPDPVPYDPTEIPAFLARELAKIQVALFEDGLAEYNTEPDKPFNGLTVLADGTNWNPGSGQGVYTYYNSTWNKLG